MEWLWNSVMAWFGWNVLAPLALILGVIGLIILIALIAAAREKVRGWIKTQPQKAPVDPQTIDYTRQTWGHAIHPVSVADDGQRAHLGGHGPMDAFMPVFGGKKRVRRLRDGDFILVSGENGTVRYRLWNVKYQSNPKDMWFADAELAPEIGAA